MLRMVFVVLIIAFGAFFAAQSAFYALLFYLWNAYFRPDDWTYGSFIGSLRLSLIIGAYLVFRTIAALPGLRLNARTVLIGLFFVQAIVGVFTSENPGISADFFLQTFSKVLIITYIIVLLVNDRRDFRTVLLVIAISLGFETAKQGWANLFRAPGAQNNNPIVFLGDNNGVAMGTMMLVPLLSALAQTATKGWERFTHRFMAVGVLYRGVTTYSRGGFLGAGALGVIYLLRAEKKVRAVIAVAVLGGLVWTVMPQAFWDRMGTIRVEEGEQRDDSAAGRLHFWQVAVDMADAKPLTGVGLSGFSSSYDDYNDDARFAGDHVTHSIWFGVLGDLGYVGLVLFVANFGLAFWSCWRVTRMTRKIPELRDLRIYGNALISTLVVYTVTGSFLSQHYSEMAWHMVGLSTALYFVTKKELSKIRPVAASKMVAA